MIAVAWGKDALSRVSPLLPRDWPENSLHDQQRGQ